MRPISSNQPLDAESRACIRRVLEPTLGAAEVQRMLDEYDGVTQEPAPQTLPKDLTRADLWAPAPAVSLQDGTDKAVSVGGIRGSLALAASGKQTELFQSDLPAGSWLDRSYRNCRPSSWLTPAVDVALRSPEPKNAGETLALAEKMYAALEMDPNDCMQKGFAGLRMMLAVVKEMGNVRVVGLDPVNEPMQNVRDDASSPTLGRVMQLHVEASFDALRSYVDAKGNSTLVPSTITEGLDTVTIGGVTLEVRK